MDEYYCVSCQDPLGDEDHTWYECYDCWEDVCFVCAESYNILADNEYDAGYGEAHLCPTYARQRDMEGDGYE